MEVKVAFITGASSGIGKALAFRAAHEGYATHLAARNESALKEICQEINTQFGILSTYSVTDVSQESDCKRFIEEGISKHQHINVLINNAGISMRGIFNETEIPVLKELMNINFWGSVYCTKFALPFILQSKGSIVGVSSIAGFKGLPARTGYSASKFALQGFLESLRNENLKTGLHVMIACPGYTESNIRKSALNSQGVAQGETPLNETKLMSSEAVAVKIWNGIKQKRWYIIMTLQGKLAVFINKWFPKLADRLTYNVISKEPDSPFK
jgi:dehydrogenase/reductase SDR family member 7B